MRNTPDYAKKTDAFFHSLCFSYFLLIANHRPLRAFNDGSDA